MLYSQARLGEIISMVRTQASYDKDIPGSSILDGQLSRMPMVQSKLLGSFSFDQLDLSCL